MVSSSLRRKTHFCPFRQENLTIFGLSRELGMSDYLWFSFVLQIAYQLWVFKEILLLRVSWLALSIVIVRLRCLKQNTESTDEGPSFEISLPQTARIFS